MVEVKSVFLILKKVCVTIFKKLNLNKKVPGKHVGKLLYQHN